MPTSRKLAGKNGKVSIGGTNISFTKWSIDDANDLQDVTGSESGGGHEYVGGLDNWSGSFEGVWDAAQNLASNPPNVVPGQKLTSCIFDMETGSSNSQYSGTISVERVKIEAVIEGKVTYSVDFKGHGSLTRPSGNIDS